MDIYRADRLPFDCREELGIIFADGFTQWLGFFSKDKNIIAKAFSHSFQLDQFYVAVVDQKIAGFVACTNCYDKSLVLEKEELKKHFGWFKGTIAAKVLKKEFEAPFKNLPNNTGSIEFVGVASEFRKQGVASNIIKYIIEQTPYAHYVIEEVADTNLAAMSLYYKLGFTETKRKNLSPRQAKKLKINSFVSFQLNKC
ncbi:GNAT family N-acetyltransferase [Enterococcus xiangfangensis]|uniref:GNAT family N-acetyltransferase n=1 Tax=Enterococcus xiangfangensis TaxID=1296537 RepID=A0ABU3FC88_9ENTE|nr:GNAT family N-acetyltransferase [Enterococcus xiangfangensis]MDT2760090.1 GNAT family N-acetyltransferase [Enterococcus xiangfangensis]